MAKTKARFLEIYEPIEAPYRVFRFAHAYYAKLQEHYQTGVLQSFLDSILYQTIVETLQEELKADAYDLCAFVAVVLKHHPEIVFENAEESEE